MRQSTYTLLGAVTAVTTGTTYKVAQSAALQAHVTYNTSGTTGTSEIIIEAGATTSSYGIISDFVTTGATTGNYFVSITPPMNYVRARNPVCGSTLNIVTVTLMATQPNL